MGYYTPAVTVNPTSMGQRVNELQENRRYVRLARYLAKRCPAPEVIAAREEITNKFRSKLQTLVSDMNKNEVLCYVQELAQLAKV